MDFRFGPQEQALREEVREFLGDAIPTDWSPRAFIHLSEAEWERAREFDRKLAARGWLTCGWSQDDGGLGMSLWQQAVLEEELANAGAPDGGGRGHGPHFVGPAILRFGSDEQKQRFIPGIVSGEDIWAQCFSEDGAGSDMANVQTTAVRDGDDYVLNGTKLWTGQGHRAKYAVVTARTGDGPKHRSTSLFMVDLGTPGVTIQPLWTLPQHGRLNLETFENARVPAANLLGSENEAWPVMIDIMNHERGNPAGPAGMHRLFHAFLREADRAEAPSMLAHSQPRWRAAAADIAIEIEVLKYLSYRNGTLRSSGITPDYQASMTKVVGAAINQRLSHLVAGAFGLPGLLAPPDAPESDMGDWFTDLWLQSVSSSIVSGTSEIMRNVIATRGLGLPRG